MGYDRGEREEKPPMAEEIYWQAVLARDPAADGTFVYGVRSTGVYCRPTCPSRRPRQAQVRYFYGPAAAEGAGFRPCKRCTPDGASLHDEQVALMQRAAAIITSNLDTPPTLSTLAAQVGLSPTYLQRLFKQVMGSSPRQYA